MRNDTKFPTKEAFFHKETVQIHYADNIHGLFYSDCVFFVCVLKYVIFAGFFPVFFVRDFRGFFPVFFVCDFRGFFSRVFCA